MCDQNVRSVQSLLPATFYAFAMSSTVPVLTKFVNIVKT